jgi:DNA-binding CsgD family transcriptional regulator
MIEFLVPEDGNDIFIKMDGGKFEQLTPESHKKLIDDLYLKIKEDYPKAYNALMELYSKFGLAKFLMINRFIKCNLSRFDTTPDFENTEFKFERINCPLRGECKHENIICNPTLTSTLSNREMEIAILISENLTDEEIANKIFRSIDTIKNHRRAILRKLNLKNKTDIALWIYKNQRHE